MTETSTPETTEEATPPAGKAGLFDHEIATFQNTLAKDGLEKALERHGFGHLHSLPGEERLLYEEQLGITHEGPDALYNLGVAHAAAGNLDRAIDLWGKALAQDPEMAEAAFNLGVACEKNGKAADARKHFEKYLELAGDSDDAAQVREHLAGLGG